MAWLYDEDINRPTVEKFKKAGYFGSHIEYDLGLGGKDDIDIVEVSRKVKKTILTADPTNYLAMPVSKFHNTGGVWIVRTKDSDEQIEFVKETEQVTGLVSYNLRKEKKVDIHPSFIDVYDCRSSRKPIRYERKKSNKKRK